MGFFGDIKRVTAATASAVSEGVTALAQGAEALNRELETLNLELALRRARKRLDNPSLREAGETEVSLRAEAGGLLDQLVSRSAGADRKNWLSEKAQFNELIRQQKCESLVAEIKAARQRDTTAVYKRPLDGVRAKQALINLLKQLVKILAEGEKPALLERSSQLIVELGREVALLEKQRDQELCDHYPNMAKRSVVRLRDGMRHGLSEYWYANGAQKMAIEFRAGKVNTGIEYRTAEGDLLLRICGFSPGGVCESTMYTQAGDRMIQLRVDRTNRLKNGYADVWLWNQLYVGRASIVGGEPRRFAFLVGLLFRPAVLYFIWRERSEAKRSPEAQSYFNRFQLSQEAFEEVKEITNAAVEEVV